MKMAGRQYFKGIGKRNGEENRFQVVVPIATFACDVQAEVDFTVGEFNQNQNLTGKML
jgi:hypothetical protein